jgi:predicted nucleic acid-binding protein
MDMAVAATVMVHALVVATRNGKDFRNRGVRLVDPFRAIPSIVEL